MTHSKLKTSLGHVDPDSMCLVSIGECMVELAPVDLSGQYQKSFAGDTLNTLWYIQQLSPAWNTHFVSRVGQDQISDDMVAMMSRGGIRTRYVQRSEDRSVGLYMISLNDGECSFNYWRSQSAARQLADKPELINAALKEANVLFFSGITLAILEPKPRAVFFHALEQARNAGKTIAFDPNLRPRL